MWGGAEGAAADTLDAGCLRLSQGGSAIQTKISVDKHRSQPREMWGGDLGSGKSRSRGPGVEARVQQAGGPWHPRRGAQEGPGGLWTQSVGQAGPRRTCAPGAGGAGWERGRSALWARHEAAASSGLLVYLPQPHFQAEPRTGAEVRLDELPGSSVPRLTLPGASWPPRVLTAHGSHRAGRATWGRMSGRQLHAA